MEVVMIEKIGNVSLDLTYYPGEDYYCDGAVEDELLSIVQEVEPSEYGRVIEERKSWPILYHLSPLRENIVDWVPLNKDAKVLEIGSGCGAITGALARKAESVTCIDLSKKRSSINAYRHKELENVTIKVGNFQDIEPSLENDYDYIFLIGVFEYAQAYINTERPYEEFLHIVKKHCKADGKVAIAIENKFGLKYFAGCREDHLGEYFTGIEDYPNKGVVRTFSRGGLEKILKACQIEDYSFYYPYPDYKFMTTLFSDERLPRLGELTSNLRNFDRSRLLLFDEKPAFDGIIREEAFPMFSNSYFLLIGQAEATVYSKYSNDRAAEYAIRTDIVKEKSGNWHVEKHPMNPAAKGHMEQILHAKELLSDKYSQSDLVVCECEPKEDGLVFPYLSGKTLEELLDECLEREDTKQLEQLLEKYMSYLNYNKDYPATDYDLIFPNLLITENSWQIIDYEWTYERTIQPEEIAQRALFCYMLGKGKREKLNLDLTYKIMKIEHLSMEELRKKELNFQRLVTGERKSLSQLRDLLHEEVLPLRDAVAIYQNEQALERMQIYVDDGHGFREEQSDFYTPEQLAETENAPKRYRLEIPVSNQVKQLRMDPAMFPCLVTLHDVTLKIQDKQSTVALERIRSNGSIIASNTFLFRDNDPNFTLPLDYGKTTVLSVEYSVVRLPDKLAPLIAMEKPRKLFGR